MQTFQHNLCTHRDNSIVIQIVIQIACHNRQCSSTMGYRCAGFIIQSIRIVFIIESIWCLPRAIAFSASDNQTSSRVESPPFNFRYQMIRYSKHWKCSKAIERWKCIHTLGILVHTPIAMIIGVSVSFSCRRLMAVCSTHICDLAGVMCTRSRSHSLDAFQYWK